jgi:tRNA U55 pseudouridine synthase TruB
MPIKVYKPIGLTPVELIKIYKNQYNINERLSFAGRLDPMAHGEMILLRGEECKQQESFCGRDKIYEFQILYGFNTDTLDILGLSNFKNPPYTVNIKDYIGEYLQSYPIYSSKTIECKEEINENTGRFKRVPLWYYVTKYGFDKESLPKKKINVYQLDKLDEGYFNNVELLEMILNKISLLSEDYKERFRYTDIKKTWELNLNQSKIYKIERYVAKVSSGTYIRSLCERMGGIAYDIKRIAVL